MKELHGKDTIRAAKPDVLYDESRFTLGVPSDLFYPTCIEDLQSILADAHANDRHVTFVGAQTGISGGSVPDDDCVAISFDDMDKILSCEKGDQDVKLVCQAGITLEKIGAFLSEPGNWPTNVPGAQGLEPGAYFYPPDPTEMTAQLGGTVATNASGARSFRYEATRLHIEELLVVLADGDTLALKRGKNHFDGTECMVTTGSGKQLSIPGAMHTWPNVKNASGYFSGPGMDLVDIFIGSEGTLGCFAEITIRLSPRQNTVSGLTFLPDRASAFAFADFLRGKNTVVAIEYFDSTALTFILTYKDAISLKLPDFPEGMNTAVFWEATETSDGQFEEEMETWEERLNALGSSLDSTWAGFDTEELERLKTFRHAVPELVNFRLAHYKKTCPQIRKIGTDSAVPGESFMSTFDTAWRMVEESGLESVIFGHLGNYHLHFNLLPSTEDELAKALQLYSELMKLAVKSGGTVSAEHGIGKIKVRYLEMMYGAKAIDQMRQTKRALDPKGILNAGTLFTLPSPLPGGPPLGR